WRAIAPGMRCPSGGRKSPVNESCSGAPEAAGIRKSSQYRVRPATRYAPSAVVARMMAKAANRTNLAAPMEPPIQLLLSGAHRLDGHVLILASAALESLEFDIGGAGFLRRVDTDPVGGLRA